MNGHTDGLNAEEMRRGPGWSWREEPLVLLRVEVQSCAGQRQCVGVKGRVQPSVRRCGATSFTTNIHNWKRVAVSPYPVEVIGTFYMLIHIKHFTVCLGGPH